MKCKYSLSNNYEIIGLCDIKKFNEKIGKVIDKSWTQITISEQTMLPSNKADIKNIIKVYVNIKINSTKMLKTPSSDMPNIEGLKITGKVLLVKGEISQNIIYTPKGLITSISSIKFKNSFSTYIVIDENSDLESDIYCVYPCVEDISIRALDEKIISKNITLFLFAHRAKVEEFEKLPNAITLKNVQNQEVVNIEFDSSNRKVLVESTGQNASDNFTMILYKPDTTTEKKKSIINANETGDTFKNDFNKIEFAFGDLIKLEYEERTRVIISNFPDSNSPPYNPNKNHQWFKITRNGLQDPESFLKTEFVFKNSTDEEIATVQFNKITKKLVVISTGKIADANPPFSFSIQKSDGTFTVTGFISSENADEFKRILDGIKFEYEDILFLKFINNKNNIKLTNYPSGGEIYSMIADDEQEFKITEDGIIENILPNIITLNNANNEPVVIIKIQVNRQKFLVKSTGKLANPGGTDYLKMTVNGIASQIAGNSNGVTFQDTFNSQNIELDSTIKLECIEPNQVTITNFPTSSTPIYKLTNTVENFKVMPNALKTIIPKIEFLINDIVIRNARRNNEEIARIKFDKTNQKLIITSTGRKLSRQDTIGFRLNTIIEKIDGGSDAASFVNALNGKDFGYAETIYISSRQFDSILVSNFPQKSQNYIQPSAIQSYKITDKGLVENILPNIITLSSENNNPVVVIKFDVNATRLLIDSLILEKPNPALGNQNYFEFKLNNTSHSIKGNQNADDFKRLFFMTSFKVGEIITIKCVKPEKVTITNFPNSRTPMYTLKNNEESFKIGATALERI